MPPAVLRPLFQPLSSKGESDRITQRSAVQIPESTLVVSPVKFLNCGCGETGRHTVLRGGGETHESSSLSIRTKTLQRITTA